MARSFPFGWNARGSKVVAPNVVLECAEAPPCVCVCVCVRERERERGILSAFVASDISVHPQSG